MIEIEDEGRGDTDSREEGVGTSVVARSDMPPVLEFSKHVFDLVALFVECLVEHNGLAAVDFQRGASFDPFG